MKPITLSIFFPTYNEQDNIRQTVEQAIASIADDKRISEYEIIIVNDGSKDGTQKVAEALTQEYPTVRLINHKFNQGYGAALISGIHAARFDYIFFTDADLQFNIYEIHSLLEKVPHYDAVIGYRAPRKDPFMRLLNAQVWNTANKILFGLQIKDIDCAFKLFKRELVQNMILKSRGAMISAEILIRLKRSGAKIAQVPVTHLPRTRGSATGAKPAVIMRALRELMILYSGDLGENSQKQLLRFGAVGIINTAVDFFGYIGLTRGSFFFGDHLAIAKVLSFFLGSISSFVLNRGWTFNRTGTVTFMELSKFYSTIILGALINVVAMQFFLTVFHLYDLEAVILATAFNLVWNFSLSKLWVWSEETKQPSRKVAL